MNPYSLPLRIRRMATRAAMILALAATVMPADARKPKNPMPQPDFTKGDVIPDGATHDWTLGATGARGWMYSHELATDKARQIRITEVAKGSPADGVLEVGDVILGSGDQPLASDARIAFAKALTTAESEAGQGELKLLRWRQGRQEQVTIKLPVLGSYSPTAPYDCPKPARIL